MNRIGIILTDPTKDPGLIEIWKEIGRELKVLALSGLAGAFMKALIDPETSLSRRFIQFALGFFTAIFLGGVIANMINAVVDTGVYAYLAAGFFVSQGGEMAIKAMQEKVYGKK